MSAHGSSAAQPVPMNTVISHMVPTFLMGLIMTIAYLAGFHRPDPHHVPIAVVGSDAAALHTMRSLQEGLGERVSLSMVPTQEAARAAMNNLQISGAFIPGKTGAEVLVAPAASDTTAMIVQRMFEAVSHKTGLPVKFTNVLPVLTNDPIGQNAFFFLVALSVTSYALGIAIAAAGATRTWRERLMLALGAAALITVVEGWLAVGVFGMFAGHALAALGITFMYSLAVILFAVGLHPLLGRFSTMVYAALFVSLNFTSSGGVFETMMQPAFFQWLGKFWIGSGFIDIMRRIVYFPGLSLTGPLTILSGWMMLGALAVVVGIWYENRHRPRPLTGEELELEEDVAV